MQLEELIIRVFCCIDELLGQVCSGGRLRQRGFAPKLSDGEVITMEIVGEFLGLNEDKAIWVYFKRHFQDWFPQLGCRTTFVRQAANLWRVKERIWQTLSRQMGATGDDVHLIDGFPLPVCHFRRAHFSRLFAAEAGYGYCAAKRQTYYGFKGHLLISAGGVITSATFTPAYVDERDAVFDLVGSVKGLLIGDKGYLRPLLSEELYAREIDLQTPLRRNMTDTRSDRQVKRLNAQRRLVETVIGQLQQRFHITASKARDLWHLTSRFTRKILAHTVTVFLNRQINSSYLDLDRLVTV